MLLVVTGFETLAHVPVIGRLCDINDKRQRDDEDDDPGAGQSPRVGERSSSSKRFLKRENLEVADSEALSKRTRFGEMTLFKTKFSEAMPNETESASHDSLAGSSGDAMRNIVGIVHFAESTIQQQQQIANDIWHEATSSITHTDTLGENKVSKTLQRKAAKQQNSWRL